MLEFLLQIGVAVKSAAVIAKKLLALFERDFSLLDALCYPYFELTDEFLWIVLNVFEHLFHGFAINDLVDVVAAVFHRKVHGIGVAEKIVQVAEYFLVGDAASAQAARVRYALPLQNLRFCRRCRR